MNNFRKSLLGAIAAAGVIASTPLYAVEISAPRASVSTEVSTAGFYKKRDRDYRQAQRRDQRLSSNSRVWRGNDGRYRCQRDDGTTGLLIGGVVGGVAGHEIAGRGDKLLGTVIGAGAGALLGREIDRSKARCR